MRTVCWVENASAGAPDRAGKLAFLKTLSVLSVPSPRPTQKGQFLLEAMASGVPVVQPRLGVFTEVVERTGGGILTEAGDIDALVGTQVFVKHENYQPVGAFKCVSRLAKDPLRQSKLGVVRAVISRLLNRYGFRYSYKRWSRELPAALAIAVWSS